MSATQQTRIFGMRLGIDPKILVLGLVVLAAVLFWYNSRADESTSAPVSSGVRPATRSAPSNPASRGRVVRRTTPPNSNTTLRLQPVDATRGDVDPTLRLEMLARLKSVEAPQGGRNLFEMGPAPLTPVEEATLKNPPKIPVMPQPPPPTQTGPTTPVVNIPLKYYGFVKPVEKGPANRGLFLDGDNVVVGSEGDVLNQRYLVVELTATSARLEDVQVKRGQTLQVVPVAQP